MARDQAHAAAFSIFVYILLARNAAGSVLIHGYFYTIFIHNTKPRRAPESLTKPTPMLAQLQKGIQTKLQIFRQREKRFEES